MTSETDTQALAFWRRWMLMRLAEAKTTADFAAILEDANKDISPLEQLETVRRNLAQRIEELISEGRT